MTSCFEELTELKRKKIPSLKRDSKRVLEGARLQTDVRRMSTRNFKNVELKCRFLEEYCVVLESQRRLKIQNSKFKKRI
jgi:hypothetical protein